MKTEMTSKAKRMGICLLTVAVMFCMMPMAVQAATQYSDATSGGHAILVNGTTKTYDDAEVIKTGDSSSEDADFYGTNAAVLAENGGTLTLTNSTVTTNGSHANGVFSYGSGTTANVANTSITTSANNSGGIMTTGGAAMNATDLTVNTAGNSSAAIRSDRGGGDVNVSGGTFKTTGVGSPAIYSTADITAAKAVMTTTASEAVVIEGGNSVDLENCTVTGDNTTKNGQAKYLNNVLIYQSMSGDASSGSSAFTMNGGTMTSKSGAMFHVTNARTTINLTDAALVLDDDALLTESADSWGTSGSNGGKATVNASSQKLAGSITVDSLSSLTLNLKNSSTYTGEINTSGQKGTVAVNVNSGCTWTLTGDTYISSLTNYGTIDTNGHTLYANGTAYTGGTTAGTASAPAKGTSKTVNGIKYIVTKAASSAAGTVAVAGAAKSGIKSAVIPAVVRINGYAFRVTAVKAGAFNGCSKLKTMTVKSKNITSIGKYAFKKCKKGMIFKITKSRYSKYKKLLKKSGLPKNAKFRKLS